MASERVSREKSGEESSAAAAAPGSRERPYVLDSDASEEEYETEDDWDSDEDDDEDVDMAGDSEIDDYRELRRMPAAARAAEPIERQRNFVRMRELRERPRASGVSRYIEDEAEEVIPRRRGVRILGPRIDDEETARAQAAMGAAQIAFNRRRFRNAFGTLHEPFYNVEAFKILLNTNPAVDAYRFQEEKAPTTGRRHLQFVIFFNKQLSGLQVKTLLGAEAHFEAVQKADHAWTYCGKEDTRIAGPWEKGSPPKQGERTDLQMLAVEVVAGKRLSVIAKENPSQWIKYSKGILQLRMALNAAQPVIRTQERFVHVRIGETRTGKTYGVIKMAADAGIPLWVKGETGKWLDTYDDEPWALIDELTPDSVPMPWMMRLLDQYDVTMELKGGTLRWKPDVIWITSNFHPKDWWSWKDISAGNGKPGMTRASYAALVARISSLTTFEKVWGPNQEDSHVVERKYEGDELKEYMWRGLGGQ